jgi:hypothetical protein
MSTDTDSENRGRLDDERTASVYRAIALRFYARYVDARKHAQFRGADLPNAEPLCTEREASDRYKRAVEGALWEPVDTADTVHALVHFAAVIAADKLMSEATGDGFGIDDEVDAMHQVIALAAAGKWLNEVAIREWLDNRSSETPRSRSACKLVLQ